MTLKLIGLTGRYGCEIGTRTRSELSEIRMRRSQKRCDFICCAQVLRTIVPRLEQSPSDPARCLWPRPANPSGRTSTAVKPSRSLASLAT